MLEGRRGAQGVTWAPGLLLLLLLAGFSQLAAAGDIMSSSKLESCIANGSQPAPQGVNASYIACSQKLIVVLTVDSGNAVATQDLSFQLSCVGSPTGICPCPCNYAADPTCTCRDLQSTLTVQLTKSPLWASYPLMYLQSFNYKPYEAIVRPGAGQCKDGQYEEQPTCNWYYSMGQRVMDSQGFVCECEAGVIWDSTFGVNTQRTRANLDCDFFSDPLDILIGRLPCSAHCLMMDPHWYGGYQLGEASLQFEISATLTTTSSDGSGGSPLPAPGNSEALIISPTVPVAVSSNRTLSAKLLGDLAGYTQIPVLSERVLMIPHPKSGQTLQDVFSNRTEWMLVDRSRITFDGSECDKVGTSFTAFRYQPGACRRAPQVCLTNQLRDLLEADRARITQGRSPLYLVSQYTYGLNSELKAFRAGALSFALPVTGIRSSVVQLEASAESLRFVTNNSPGKILAGRMCTFAETRCGGFEASAATGYLHAWLANTGTLPASYTIVVTDCTINIRPVDAQRVALAAGQNGTISPFRIFVEDDQAGAERSCWLKMLDATGLVTDAKQVVFYTNATAYEEWPSGGLLGNGTGEGNLKLKNCSAACPNKFDMACAFKNRCWSNIGSMIGLFVGVAAGFGLMVLAVKYGWIASLLSMCSSGGTGLCGSCFGGTSNSRDARGSRRDQQQQQQEQQRPKRNSAASRESAKGGKGGGKGGKLKQTQKGRHKGSRSSLDSSGDGSRSSSRGSYEDDQQVIRTTPKGGNSPKGKTGSTSRRPSAAAAAAAAAAAGAAATATAGRRRSRQTSGALLGAAGEAMFIEYEDSRQQWGSGAGDGEGVAGTSKPYRPASSSAGGSRKVSSRMQPSSWDDSAAGGYGGRSERPSSAVAAVGGKLLRQPSAAATAGNSSGSGRVSRQVRSSSVDRAYAGEGHGQYEGQERGGLRELGSAYGSSQQSAKQGSGRLPRRPSAGQSSTGGAGFADGFIPAMWNPTYDGANDNNIDDADYDDPGIMSSGITSSPPRPMRMTSSSPGQQQQQRSSTSRARTRDSYMGGYESSPPAQMTSSSNRMTSSPLPRQLASSAPGSRSASPAGPGYPGLVRPSMSPRVPAGTPMQGRLNPTTPRGGGLHALNQTLNPQDVFLNMDADEAAMISPKDDNDGRMSHGMTHLGQEISHQGVYGQQGSQEAYMFDHEHEQQQGYGRRAAALSIQQQEEDLGWPPQQQQQQRARPSAAAAAVVGGGGQPAQVRRVRPSSGYVSDSGALQQQQQQQQYDRGGSPSSLRSFGSSPGGSPVRSATPGRAVLQQNAGHLSTAGAAAAAAAGGGSDRRSSAAVRDAGMPGSMGSSSRGSPGQRTSRAAAAHRVGVPGVPAVHARTAPVEQYRQHPQQQQQQLRSPFAAAVSADGRAGLSPGSRSSPGGSPSSQQKQQRRMTLQQQQYGVAAAAAAWEAVSVSGGRGSGPRSPSRRPRSSSSNSSSGLSPTGQQQQQYRQQQQQALYSPRRQQQLQQQNRGGVSPRQDEFCAPYSDEEDM